MGWSAAKAVAGGAEFTGSWPDVWRANLLLRTASRVLVRVGHFRAEQLGALYGKSTELPWTLFMGQGRAFRVEATCRKSKIYHSGAAAERVSGAIARTTGAEAQDDEGVLEVLVRIVNNDVTISIDSSGALLHRRGFKQQVGKAPLRETLASAFLMTMGYRGDEPLVDPFCGSGTIVLEAADIALGLAPGRARRFAFESFTSFRADAYGRARTKALATGEGHRVSLVGSDRASAAIEASRANAERAGVGELATFHEAPISALVPPDGPPGLVLTNPPYGSRIGEPAALRDLYQSFGAVMRERFGGWRVGLLTSEEGLARATGLALEPGPPVPHGSLKVRLWQGRV